MSSMKTVVLTGLTVGMALFVSSISQAGTCRDPWVDQAIREVTGREPNGNYESGDCNVRNFNNASWNSYTELKRYVRGYFARSYSPVLAPAAGGTSPLVNTAYNQQQIAANSLRSNPLIGHDGATLIGDGGGTLRRDAYGNLIGHDGATVRNDNSN